jgi:HPt (histidine-containing phosphotransfer) domain-containing protein
VSAVIVSDLADDEDMTELLDGFVVSLATQATRLEEASAAGDHDAVRRIAHQIKGAAGGYGFPTITAAAGRLEHHAHEAGEAALALAEVCGMCRRARARADAAPAERGAA